METTRKKLYDLVWTKPMTRLSKEFGFSDVGLAKICRKHDIPLPERGYWAKLDAGHHVPKRSLPNAEQNPNITIPKKPVVTEQALLEKQAKKQKEAALIEHVGKLVVPTEILKPHRLTKGTQKFFVKVQKEIQREAKFKDTSNPHYIEWMYRAEYGRYQCPYSEDSFPLRVSLELADRAICILDTLVKRLEQLGFKFYLNDNHESYRVSKFEAVKDGEYISFRLTEGYKKRVLSVSEYKAAKEKYLFASETERVPSGILTFTMHGRENYFEKKFVDGKKQLEVQLPMVVAAFMNRIEDEKETRARELNERLKYQEVQRIRAIEQDKMREQQKQFDDVVLEATNLKEYREVAEYLDLIEAEYVSAHGQLSKNVADWFETVRLKNDQKNPMIQRLAYLNKLS